MAPPVKIALAVAVLALGGCGEAPTTRSVSRPILRGAAASGDSLTAVGALVAGDLLNSKVFCSGTLISERLVLTAAHCFDVLTPGSSYGFFFGERVEEADAEQRFVSAGSRQLAPGYQGGAPPADLGNYDDLALVQLSQPLVTVTPIRLVRPGAEVSSLLQQGAKALIVGFGQTDPSSKTSKGTRVTGEATIDKLGTHELRLAASATGPQKCGGDSGGPTLGELPGPAGEARLIGVASRAGAGCTGGSIETRVDAHLSWIHQQGAIPCGSGLSPACPAKPKAIIGQACSGDDACASGLCIDAGGGAGGRVCSRACGGAADAPCPLGFTCVSSRCEALCRLDADCPPGGRCDEATSTCAPPAVDDPPDGACSLGPGGDPGGAWPLLLALALLGLLRRPGRWSGGAWRGP